MNESSNLFMRTIQACDLIETTKLNKKSSLEINGET